MREKSSKKLRSIGEVVCVTSTAVLRRVSVIHTRGPSPLFSEFCSDTLAICLPVLHSTPRRPTMFQQLDYQECYREAAHESVINAMALSPDGRRLITGSADSTVLMWSTQSGSTLCRIKIHSPVLSLAWLKHSNGFLFGCENGILASVNISEVLIMCSGPFNSHSR